MASAPHTSSSSDAKKERLSFAKVCEDSHSPPVKQHQEQQRGLELTSTKIAAAGIKPPNMQQNSNINSNNSNQKHEITSSPRDGTAVVTPSSSDLQQNSAPKQKKLVQIASKEHTDPVESDISGPELRVQIVESVPRRTEENAPEGLLAPAADDTVTQVSSSSDSNKPQSLDGKSVASGTTFALDEKDSIRPDDSASVKAGDEDDMFSPPGSGLPGSRIGSDDGVRAFRDQLREISSMEPQRRSGPPPVFGNVPKGVLYVPPAGPGIGAVPNVARSQPANMSTPDVLPDQKLLEALENPRDRVWVLKLEQDVIDFVKNPKEVSLMLPQCHSFYRLLAHKMADYYMLGHLVDDTSAAVKLFKTPNCRIPPPLTGITAPSTAASTPPPSAPQMKILRRGAATPGGANGSKMRSKDGSETGDSGEDDKKPKAPVTREEREARYEAARLRIMGSAKPTDSPEAPKEKQDSRSSSTTGKKHKKKQRTDSEDGFEARSAYSNYFTTSFGSDQQPSSTYGYPDYSNATSQLAAVYGQQPHTSSMSHMTTPTSAHAPWSQPYQTMDSTQAWAQGQSGAYDLSSDFQRMSFQNQVPSQNASPGWGANYSQQYYGSQQSWRQQQYQTQSSMAQPGYGYAQAYSSATPAQLQHDQPYAYGQLPSQTFPGRPPSNNEHPLPGSYKGKHFNPQSQTFVPGQVNSGPFTTQAAPMGNYGSGYSTPAQLQRQGSSQSHGSAFGSSPLTPHHTPPHTQTHTNTHTIGNRVPSQPLTHPLPQGPVFPQQPSPSVPLPPKPGTTPQRPNEYQTMSPAGPGSQNAQNKSLLAKWGAPASLPAKPPPPSSADGFDGSKFSTQTPRPTYANPTAAARQSNGGGNGGLYPTFGSMPTAQIVDGSSGGYGSKRT